MSHETLVPKASAFENSKASFMKEIYPEKSIEGRENIISFLIEIPHDYSMTYPYLKGVAMPHFTEFSVYDAKNNKLAHVTMEDISVIVAYTYPKSKQHAYERLTNSGNAVSYQPLIIPGIATVDHFYTVITQPYDSTRTSFTSWSREGFLRIEVVMPKSYEGKEHTLFVDFTKD